MIYRIIIDLSFTTQDALVDIEDKALDHLDDALIINPGQPHEERGFITLLKCYHDEDPNRPCEVIKHHDVL